MKEKILILCKTYPAPSEKFLEITCVAGVTDQGELVRVFPVPFRHLSGDKQFRKWQWIEADTAVGDADGRRESRKIRDFGSINLLEHLDSKQWPQRLEHLKGLKVYTSWDDVWAEYQANYTSLVLFKPLRIVDLEIEKERQPDWTPEELAKLKGNTDQMKMDFGDEDRVALGRSQVLEKIPYAFRYVFEYEHEGELRQKKMIIKDWELAALYRNLADDPDWEQKFRAKIFDDMLDKDLMFLLGNMKAVPKQWMIVSLIYPPKPSPQQSLF